MKISLPQPTPLVTILEVHETRRSDLEEADDLVTFPNIPSEAYRDGFGNRCRRMMAPQGEFVLSTDTLCRDTGLPDPVAPTARQHAVQDLPVETLVYLLGSRYCDTDLLSDYAWRRFGEGESGWARVQAICDHAHQSVIFGYDYARSTRTAAEALAEGKGVCRDFAHLAIALCRCVNIPARYCTGYLSDIGEPLPHAPGDFAAWMEVYLENRWWVFDPRNNAPHMGRILIARGRDAADVPLIQTFGAHVITDFQVWTDEVVPGDVLRKDGN